MQNYRKVLLALTKKLYFFFSYSSIFPFLRVLRGSFIKCQGLKWGKDKQEQNLNLANPKPLVLTRFNNFKWDSKFMIKRCRIFLMICIPRMNMRQLKYF